LFTACQCLVHPYRGEGFALPVLEAMACGLPVIVTAGGATDDFVTDDFGFRMEAEPKVLGYEVGPFHLVRPGWWLEPAPEIIEKSMRHVFEHRDEAARKGLHASEYVARHWTWDNAAAVARGRMIDLLDRKEAEARAIVERRAKTLSAIDAPPVAKIGCLQGARELLTAGRIAEAWACASEAIRMRPFHPEGWLLLGEIALKAGSP